MRAIAISFRQSATTSMPAFARARWRRESPAARCAQCAGGSMSDPKIQPHLDLSAVTDRDPQESAEWRDALLSVLRADGPARVRELMDMLAALARDPSVGWQ